MRQSIVFGRTVRNKGYLLLKRKKENNVVVEVVMITLLSVMWFSQPLVVNITELPSRILPRSCLHIDGAEPETNARIGNQRNI